jgi:hypothetical protein
MSISFVWREIELSLSAAEDWVEFEHESGLRLRRPRSGTVVTRTASGSPRRSPAAGAGPVAWPAPDGETNPFYAHGFWRMSPGGRSLVQADGKPALLIADTAWGLPWRATPEQVREYAADRQAKGFNAVLLMSVQPIVYREDGGPVMVIDDTVPLSYTIVDPRDGSVVASGKRDTPSAPLPDAGGAPRVYICL